MRLTARIITWLLLAGFCCPVATVRADDYDSREVKVAFLYNFAKFVAWPDLHPGQDLVIGIYGENPFGPAWQHLGNKQVNGHPLRRIRVSTLTEAESCQILYIATTVGDRLPGILAALQGKPVLTISDLPGFTGQGGMIGLLEQNRRIRFSINLDATRSAALVLDAQLLNLAVSVVHREGN